MKYIFTLLSLYALSCNAAKIKNENSFPDDFKFGVSTSSYQIEGAWDENGKGESILDRWVHTEPWSIKDNSTGDVATDSYHNFQRDVEMLRELGVDTYRFSISWPRILPTGFSNKISWSGVNYYNNLINELLQYNIEPVVTLFHWEMPVPLQNLGGFANPSIAEWFEDYTRVAYALFGDRVKKWITINEPRATCHYGYGTDQFPPKTNSSGIASYICTRNILLAHARAYHAYNEEFKPDQRGECGISITVDLFESLSELVKVDQQATDIKKQLEWGLFMDPIFSENGGFPVELISKIARKSEQQGYKQTRLPQLTDEEIELIKGSADFLGINHYTCKMVTEDPTEYEVPSDGDDADAVTVYDLSEWKDSASTWLKLVPDSLYKVLNELKVKYNNPLMYITENGWFTSKVGLDDEDRVIYYKSALEDVLRAIDNGVNIKGYSAWSLMDNFEWMHGYTRRYGFYEVDFNDVNRTRTARKSAYVYKNIIETRIIDPEYQPDLSIPITIGTGH